MQLYAIFTVSKVCNQPPPTHKRILFMTEPLNFIEKALIEIDNDVFALQGEKNLAGELSRRASFLEMAIQTLVFEREVIVKFFSRRIRDAFLTSPNFKE